MLTWVASRAAVILRLSLGQEGMPISSYEELQLITSVVLLIVAILTYKQKIVSLLSGKE